VEIAEERERVDDEVEKMEKYSDDEIDIHHNHS
jgi:hypothetical protein